MDRSGHLSVLCLEDKIVQQAVVYVLEAIFEEDFIGFSYGFRPGRGHARCVGRSPYRDLPETA